MKGNLYKMSRNKDKYESANRRQQIFMSPEDVAAGKKSNWTGIEITGCVRNISPSLWEFEHLTALYLNDNHLLRLPADIGLLVNLRTLDVSSNKLRSLPAELGELIQLRELLLNNNFLRVLPYEIGKLFHLHVLGLMGNPLQKEFLSIYNEPNGTQKLLTYMLDNLSISVTPPPQRPWIPLAKPNKSRPACLFTVMCYNVLCDKYATRQMYGYCPSWALNWEYRKKAILDEIRHYSADIISLQEIETEQFYNFFLPELKNDGYEGIFSPKSRAKTMSEVERKYVDGCAIFFRTLKFSLIKEHLIEFNQLAMANAEGSDNMLNRVMPKDNIGLAALLKVKDNAWDPELDVTQTSQALLVCTAHIHWDPEFCDVKLIQTMMLSNELKTIIDEASHSFRPGHKNDLNSVQLLLCGDFNSLPDSGVVEFLSKGRVNMDHSDFKDMGYKSCLQRLLSNDTSEFTHSFKLASAYSEDIMPYTNYTFDFKGIIDYIFYTKTGMVPLGLLGPISNEWLRENKVVGCPHPHIPSDHFPLLVELELMHTASQQLPPNGLISRR
ncbi:CCR4-NOT transcription complex subunit 6-like isoform X2 [Musca domestica]|uniref:poly(A)-specific ribonuclease n=1 Tax=Musca domestica TaxID=7370 RepID=A0A1I8NBS3_MUSDO|nr:CCR4-NOT transcription complex subunit 6-like isoform X2 [Musca domestica]XP_011290600.1 CCR4-NOT transcription complex subunit 6-like isoform X2 [Musca domestica]XP_011290601.1 CCR4-NOT transcription complex subunit 6-like isoform X2 [Musca domestica]XP_011290602.1 CCR4-NOT transcription complex subunit 6-like isoform X2 [Musca domestica]XP_058976364.1 CCR4-NOT transcription complex subunit 6-like isoform X2 [Musca domestica]XP_058976375.1 CCR4-NOT transcription complex subunit 6-like isof